MGSVFEKGDHCLLSALWSLGCFDRQKQAFLCSWKCLPTRLGSGALEPQVKTADSTPTAEQKSIVLKS